MRSSSRGRSKDTKLLRGRANIKDAKKEGSDFSVHR